MILEEEIYDLLSNTPAISKETVSTWEVFEQVKDIPDIRPFSFFVTLPGIEQWMVDERIRQSGKSIHVNPELLGVGYYAPFSINIEGIMANNLGSKINSAHRDHMHWTGLSKDGKSLIITSERTDLGSRGGHDEWISHQNAKGEWQEPINLGDSINTDGEDMCWTFTPDGKKFTGSWGPQGTFDTDIRWIYKDDIPLLKDFEPIGPPPNLLKRSELK